MGDLAEFRGKFPQYNDLADDALADALHQKYYSDLPKETVYGKLGVPLQKAAAPAAPARAPTVQYETQLSSEEEPQFQQWKAQNAPNDTGADYDLRGAFKAGLQPDAATGHWPDTFKKPNHPTFSIESQYAKDRPDLAGRWEGDKYVAPVGAARMTLGRGGQPAVANPIEYPTVTSTGVMALEPQTPIAAPPKTLIEQRGAPVTAETFQAEAQRQATATPEQAAAAREQPGYAGSVAKAATRALEQGARTDFRRQELVHAGAAPQTAENIVGAESTFGVKPQAPQFADQQPGTEYMPEPTEEDAARKEWWSKRSSGVRGITKGVLNIAAQSQGLADAAYEAMGAPSPSAKQNYGALKGFQDSIIGAASADGGRHLEGILESTVTQVPWLALGIARGAATIPLLAMGLGQFGDTYSEARAAGVDVNTARLKGGIFAAAEVLGELVGVNYLTKGFAKMLDGIPPEHLKARSLEFLTGLLEREIPGELGTTTTEFIADKWGPGGLHPEWTAKDYAQQIVDTIIQTAGQVGLMGAAGSMAGGFIGKRPPGEQIGRALQEDVNAAQFVPGSAEAEAIRRLTLDPARAAAARATIDRLEAQAALAGGAPVAAPGGPAPGTAGDLKDAMAEPGKPLAEKRQEDAAAALTKARSEEAAAETERLRVEAEVDAQFAKEEAEAAVNLPTITAAGAAADKGQLFRTKQEEAVTVRPGEIGDLAAAEDAAARDGSPKAPIIASTPEDVAAAGARTNQAPTPKQIDAENYAKGRLQFEDPLKAKLGVIAIETPKGGTRTAKDGSWSVPNFPATYGHLPTAMGNDGDKADIFIGDAIDSPVAFVIDQVNLPDRSYDETKSFVGFPTKEAAIDAYARGFSDGKGMERIGAITEMPIAQFVNRARADNLKNAVAYVKPKGKPNEATIPTEATPSERPVNEAGAPGAAEPAAQEGAGGPGTGNLPVPREAEGLPAEAVGQGPHYAAGAEAFKAGKPRDLPLYFTNRVGANPKAWLRGWDEAQAQTPAKPDKAKLIPTRGPGGSIEIRTEPVVPKPESKYTAEDVADLTRQIEGGSIVLFGGNDVGLPEIQSVKGATFMGYGVFKAETPDYSVTFEGGSAMQRTPSGRPYTVVSVKSGTFPYDTAGVLETLRRLSPAGALLSGRGGKLPNAPAALTPEQQAEQQADADIAAALGELGDLLGKSTRLNITPEQEQKLFPILTKLFDAAFRKGYIKFKQAARFVRDTIAKGLGQGVADQLTLDHYQGAYISMAGRYRDKGAENAAAVAAVQSLEEKSDEYAGTGDTGKEALGGMAPGAGEGAESGGPVRGGDARGGDAGTAGDTGPAAEGVSTPRSGGGGAEAPHPAGTGTRGGRGGRGKGRTRGKRSGVPAAPAGVIPEAPNIPGANFRITDEVRLGQGGEAEKFRDNLAAIKTLKNIEADNRRATPEEQRILARYVGWGGLANAFADEGNPLKDDWKERGTELAELLTPQELRSAKRTTRNAHYTSETIIDAMWDGVLRVGFKGGMMLEHSMGAGNFIGLMPDEVIGSTNVIGVEYDSLTSRIAALLYPQAAVLHAGFQKVPVPDGEFALNIGNPPFGQEKLRFQFKPGLNHLSIHNQFMLAGQDALRPGGIQAMVVSRYMMDQVDSSAREEMATKVKLLGAIRLPDTAFRENARTDVVTDMLFFQRLTPAEQAEMEDAVAAKRRRPEKKRTDEAERERMARMVPSWTETTKVPDPLGGADMTVNSYFAENPDMIMGVLERSGKMQAKGEEGKPVNVRLEKGASLKDMLARAIENLPEDAVTEEPDAIERAAERFKSLADALRIVVAGHESGAILLEDGKLTQIIDRETPSGDFELTKRELRADSPWSQQFNLDKNGKWYRLEVQTDASGKPVKQEKNGKQTKFNAYTRTTYETEADVPDSMRLGDARFEKLKLLIRLRDLAKAQIVMETGNVNTAAMEANRKKLAYAYEKFVQQHGLLHLPKNASLIAEMPDEANIISLELFYRPELTPAMAKRMGEKPRPASATPSAILKERLLRPYAPPGKADTPADALAITLAEFGRVDLPRMASLLGVTEDEVIAQLFTDAESPLIFQDPETSKWETSDNYLSGQVRRKLEAARAAGLQKNADALAKVQPEPWGSDKVTAIIGASWMPTETYQDFLRNLTGADSTVRHAAITNSYMVVADDNTQKAKEWSSPMAPFSWIVTRMLNSQSLRITTKDEDDRTIFHEEETALAILKAKEIESAFADWVFADRDRRTQLVGIFNDKFNTRVQRQHGGQHLILPGKVPDATINMRRHQKNTIWRGISERFMLMDHVVGSGKTYTYIAIAMERRRMGLSRKPMIIVPNHLVAQTAAAALRLYPGANVLAIGKHDLSRKRRRRSFAKVATGDWDLVIMPESSFGFVGIAPETEERFLDEELRIANQAIEDAWEAAREDGTDGGRFKPFTVKEAERLAEKIQTRLDGLRHKTTDRLLTFEQMGIDLLMVDEAHSFKNLFYSSRLSGVSGMNVKVGSQKAFDLYTKIRVLRESPTGAVVFGTGTPISNSAVEMYQMMRYLAADEMRDLGLEHFDAWRAQYVDINTKWEPTESGRLKEVNRLGRSWSNMRSLMDLYYSFTDSVTQEDIDKAYAEDNNGEQFPIPKVKGGKRQEVVVKPTPAQTEQLEGILAGFDGLSGIDDYRERNKERLRLMDRAKKVSLDARMLDPRSDSKEEGGKLDTVARKAADIYRKWDADKGTQLIFLDRGVKAAKQDKTVIKAYDAAVAERDQAMRTNDEEAYRKAVDKLDAFDPNEIAELKRAAQGGWNAYDQLKANLVAQGIPENEIRFIGEANTDLQKQAIFDAVNAGEIRILIGSTPKMGAGTNVQRLLVALHHVDVTWKPSDIEQREGRILRQDNALYLKYPNFEVEILAYVTERTVDAKLWDVNSTKLRTINGIRKYGGEFNMDFEDEEAVGMAEIAALASGDPLLLERVKVTSEIDKLELLERAFRRKQVGYEDEIEEAERVIRTFPGQIVEEKALAAEIDAHLKTIEERARARRVTVEGKEYASRYEAQKAATDAVTLQQAGNENARYSISVNGIALTSKEAIEDGIADALGDATAFEASIQGAETGRRLVATRALTKRANEMLEGLGDDPKSLSVGTIIGYKAKLQVQKSMWSGRYVTITLSDENGKTVGSGDKSIEKKATEFSGNAVRSALDQAVDTVIGKRAASTSWMEDRIVKAKENLPRLKSHEGDVFDKAAELEAKRARLQEIIGQLAVTATPPVGAVDVTDDEEESKNVANRFEAIDTGEEGEVSAETPAARDIDLDDKYSTPAVFSDRYLENQDAIAEGVIALAKQIVPQVNTEVVGQLFRVTEEGGKAEVAGRRRAAENLIQVALRYESPESTLRHEAVHSFFDMGLLSGAEERVLKAKAKEWREKYGIDKRYKHLAGDEVALGEEGMADAYGAHRRGEEQFGGFIGSAFAKISRFLRRLGNFLQGMEFQTFEDVFARMESGEVGRRAPKKPVAPTQDKFSAPAEKEAITTRVHGVEDVVLDREMLTPERTQGSIEHAKRIFDEVGLDVVERGAGLWDVANKGAEPGALDDAGYRLLEALRREVRNQNAGPESPEIASLLTSVAEYVASGENQGMSAPLRIKLYGVAQGERSHRGLLLGALAQHSPESLNRLARNIEGALERVYAQTFDVSAEVVQSALDDVMRRLRDQFTDDDLAKIAEASPDLMKLIDRLSAAPALKDIGGRLYRKVQFLFKDKTAKTFETMAEDARVNEAVQKIIDDLKQFGIEPKEQPGKKVLTPIERLMVMVNPETSEMIDERIAQAIVEAERNAGIAATMKDASPDERDLMREAFRKGLEPSPEMVEQGMQADDYRHWRVLRDNLLGYSPTTLKLVQQVVQGTFKGTKFGQKAPKPVDVRIDINKLARSPAKEVQRVLDEAMQAIEEEMLLAEATPETMLRVSAMLQGQVTAQLEAARARVRDKAFEQPQPGPPGQGMAVPRDQRLRELFNAGLLKDQRLDAAVAAIAKKSAVRRLMPNLGDMVKKVFATRFYRQGELQNRFGRALSLTFGLSEPERKNAEKLFAAAFATQFAKAKAKALDTVHKSLTPKQQKTVRKVRKLWETIERAVNAGAFDSAFIMQEVALSRGWTVPTDAQLAEIRTLANREQELRELTDGERATAERSGNVAEAEAEKAAATLSERARLKREMQALWLRWTAPLGWKTAEGRRNVARAVNEITSANLLLRPGFFARQLIDVATQTAIYTPTRAVGEAIVRYRNDKTIAGRQTRLWRDAGEALKDAYGQRTKALRAALAAVRRGLAGRSETKNVEQILDNISIFDRAELKADELADEGKTAQAFMVRMANYFAFSFRYAKALDELQGTLAEAQEMQARVITELREHGATPEEARTQAAWVMGDVNAEFQLALARTQQMFDAAGLKSTPAQLEQSAWDVVKARQYGRIQALKLDAEDFKGQNRVLRNVIGWNEREMGGFGGVIAGFGRSITTLAEQIGLPMPLARFSNAIGISINRALTFTPLGFFSQAFKDSPWYEGERNATQRKIEAAAGTSVGLMMLMLVAAGVLIPRFKWPEDEAEREVWRKLGRQPGTVEIMIGGGKYITVSLTVGPLSMVRPYLVFMGSIMESLAKHEKKAEKLARKAEEAGLQPAMAEKKQMDILYAAALAGYSTFLGGRTAVGIISNLTDYRAPQPGRTAAGLVSPLIPGAPQWQELSRMQGVQLDANRASVLDFMFPTGGTAAEKRNFFYDPLNDQTTERIVKVMTGGTWPLATLPIHKDTEKAYRVLYETGWRPPGVQNQAREIGDQYRAFDVDELEKYRELRGRYLKKGVADANLDGLTANEKLEELDAVAQEANQDAIDDVIDMIEARTSGTGASPKIPALKPRPAAPREIRP